ncbi:MAG: GGDEF domain-containing protein [Desulfuromonadaceae bacterium]
MNLNEFLSIKVRNNPDSLLNLLVKVACMSIVIVIVVSGFGFYRVFSAFVIKEAENSSVNLCSFLVEQQKNLFFITQSGKDTEIGLHEAELKLFDTNIRNYLEHFSIIKVKLYNAEKRIVYCTDPKLIGKVDDKNQRLKRALAGIIDTHLVTKDQAVDLANEKLFDVDVVETYVPIIGPNKKVIGSFELYVNITAYREQIRYGAVLVTSFLTVVLITVFGFSYLLIRGGAAQLKEAQTKLETMAATDVLTTLSNRGHLLSRGKEEFERLRRSRTDSPSSADMGCIMIDIDHFKKVNDTYGHLAGDAVLKEVARRLSTSVRPYDVVGRYGGEEFVIMLPDTSMEQCLIIADRIRGNIRTETIEAEGRNLSITASLGVARTSEADMTLSDVLKRADAAMYKAKADGRDRVVQAVE